MKKTSLITLIFVSIFFWGLAFAEAEKPRGASPKAYEKASDKAIFNRISDWFATVGKSQEEKERILEERKEHRIKQQVEKEARETEREMRKEEMQKRIPKERGKSMGDDAGRSRGKPAGIPRGRGQGK